MNDATSATLSLSAAFLAGLMSSTHCFAMCGGLAGAAGMRARTLGCSPQRSFGYALTSQIGRIGSYTFIGAIAGVGGASLATLLDLVHLANLLRAIAGLLLIMMAIRIAARWNPFAFIERLGARIWSRISPLALGVGQLQSGIGQSLLFGVVWGWLPCGLVYSMVLFAVAAGTATQGALTMAAFGIGTLPAMLSSSLMASQLARVIQSAAIRWMAALALAAYGMWTAMASGSLPLYSLHG